VRIVCCVQTLLNRDATLVGPIVTGGPGDPPPEFDQQLARINMRDVSLDPLVQDWRGFGICERPTMPATDYDLVLTDRTLHVTTDPLPEPLAVTPSPLTAANTMLVQLSFVVNSETTSQS
jgi:hypothetical protein